MLEDAPPRGLGERLLALRSFSLLAPLPASDLALVARLSRERDFQAGQTLAVEGEAVPAAQLIVAGRASLSRAGAPVETAGPLDTIGLLPIAAGVPHPFGAVALEPIQALEIDAELVAEVLEDDFALFLQVLRLAASSALSRGPARARIWASTRGPGARAATHPGPLDAAHKLFVLRDTALFARAPIDGLAAFAKRLEAAHLPAGAELRTDAAAGELIVIAAGCAEVRGHPQEVEPGCAGPGAVLGALASLAGTPAPLHIRARTSLHFLRGAVSDLFDVLEDHHALGRRLIAEMM